MNTLWGWGRASWAGCGPDVRRGGQTLIMGYSADKSPLIGHLAGPLRRLEPLVAQRQEKCGPNRPTPTGYSCNNAAEQVEAAHATTDARGRLEDIVADKGYHSNETMVDLAAVGLRSYISEPDRGRRDWSGAPDAYAPVQGNRRRLRGPRGRRLRRRRAELAERSFAHHYETGGIRRTHLRGHDNILKRLLIHGGGFNLGLAMRQCLGIGTPRRLQGRAAGVLAVFIAVWARLGTLWENHEPRFVDRSPWSSPRESQGLNTDC